MLTTTGRLIPMLAVALACATQTGGNLTTAASPIPATQPGSAISAIAPIQATASIATASTNLAALDPTIGLTRDAKITEVLREVSPTRLRMIDSMLVSFGTRQTNSDTLSTTRGVGAARRWIHAELSRYAAACNGCLKIEYDAAMFSGARIPVPVNVVNVLARLPGRDTMRVIVVGGHYDSCLCSVPGGGMTESVADAPGADDDGSGTAAVMELARVFSIHYPRGLDATIIFATYAGEEQGTYGSQHLAERLHAENKTVVAAITNDIVGNVVADDGRTDSTTVRVFSPDPDNGLSRELGRYVWGTSLLYMPAYRFKVLPVFRLDRIGRGGDHRTFVELGDPGIRFTELLENYKRQHLPTDVLEHVNFGYVANVARTNATMLASLAQAPPMPGRLRAQRDIPSGGSKFRLTWPRTAGAAAYDVLVRRTFAPTWEVVVPVADTTMLLDYQVDDMYVGVRSVGANGHRSMPSLYPAPPPTGGRGGGAGPGGGGAAGAGGRGAGAPPPGATPPPQDGPPASE
jgi:hypothetical protein